MVLFPSISDAVVGTAEAGGDRAVTGATAVVTGMGIAVVATPVIELDTGPASVILIGKICTRITVTSREQPLIHPRFAIARSLAE